MSGTHRRALRLVSLLDATDFAGWVVAALLDVDSATGEAAADLLVERHLMQAIGVDSTGQVRYRLHDLVRAFGRELAAAEASPDDVSAALGRAFSAWLALAERAVRLLPAGPLPVCEGAAPRRPPDPAIVAAVLADPVTWLEREHLALAAAIRQAGAAGQDETAWELLECLGAYCSIWGDANSWQRAAMATVLATRRGANLHGRAHALRNLGDALLARDELAAARLHHDEGLALFVELGDVPGEAHALSSLAQIASLQGRVVDAEAHLARCLPLLRSTGDRRGEGYALHRLGLVTRKTGALADAADLFAAAMAAFRSAGDRFGERLSLLAIGELHRRAGRHDEAMSCLTQCLGLARELRQRQGEAYTVLAIGRTHLEAGHLDDAGEWIDRSVTALEHLGDGLGSANARHSLGELHLARAEPVEAARQFRAALAVFRHRQTEIWQARTLAGLGRAMTMLGDDPDARESRRETEYLLRSLRITDPATLAAVDRPPARAEGHPAAKA